MEIYMDYLLFLFDFDYTLVDSSRGIITSFNLAFNDIGFPQVCADVIKKTIGQPLEMAFYNLTDNKSHTDFAKFRKSFIRNSQLYMTKYAVVYKDVVFVLDMLKHTGKRVGIISAKDHYTIHKIAEKNHFLHCIDIIIGEDDVSKSKPNPEALYLAASTLKVDYERILYIGDSVIDAQMANDAHINFLPVVSGTTTAKEFDFFDKVGIINSLSEIVDYMK